MDKKKILWVGDAVAPTGFATVSHSVIEQLLDRYEVHQLGVNYYGDPHEFNYKIYPAILGGEVYGVSRITQLIQTIKPDLIFIINDAWIIDLYLQQIKNNNVQVPVVVYFPVDAEEHSLKWYNNFDLVSKVCAYTEFGKRVILDVNSPNVTEEKIEVIPHGMDVTKFFPVDKQQAREILFPKDRTKEFADAFIILNANRNQPRKRIDITLWAFREFAKGKPDAKLYLHMGTTDFGIDIIEAAIRYGFADKLIITANVPGIPGIPVDRMNLVYNACDVGINTSMGEGWGLVNWEHAATMRPQILPEFSAIPEIWKPGTALFLQKSEVPQMFPNVNTVGQVVSLNNTIETLEWAYNDWKTNQGKELAKVAKAGYDLVTSEEFSWKSVADKFDKVFKELL